jgi:uracil-DNA glycosylase
MEIISDELDKLIEEIKKCKMKKTCPRLTSRAYYFEPNGETIETWQSIGYYTKGIDNRVMFVCESPGPTKKYGENSVKVEPCWFPSERKRWRDNRFLDVRKKYGLENCYITNVVKCGVRQGKKHPEEECINCSEWLRKEIEIINPKKIVAVGLNAEDILKKNHKYIPQKKLITIKHYSLRRNPWDDWDEKFPNLLK